jgi:hypothetical protein
MTARQRAVSCFVVLSLTTGRQDESPITSRSALCRVVATRRTKAYQISNYGSEYNFNLKHLHSISQKTTMNEKVNQRSYR